MNADRKDSAKRYWRARPSLWTLALGAALLMRLSAAAQGSGDSWNNQLQPLVIAEPLTVPHSAKRADSNVFSINDCSPNPDADDLLQRLGQQAANFLTCPIHICATWGHDELEILKGVSMCVESLRVLPLGNHVTVCAEQPKGKNFKNCELRPFSGNGPYCVHLAIDGHGYVCKDVGGHTDCGDVRVPVGTDPDAFRAKLACMAQHLTEEYSFNYDVVQFNCGGYAKMLLDCAGGTANPAMANLGLGCGWESVTFNQKGTPPIPRSGADVCAQLRSQCECSPNPTA